MLRIASSRRCQIGARLIRGHILAVLLAACAGNQPQSDDRGGGMASTTSVKTQAPVVAATAGTKPACPDGRRDAVSASVAARLCAGRVEVLSQRTETTQVFAEPAGGYTAESYVAPVRFREGESWKDVDLTLTRDASGMVRPKAHPYGLVLSGAAGDDRAHDLATLGHGGDRNVLGWSGALPEPVLTGTTATYREVRPGLDLVMEVTRTGFEQFLVVKNRQALSQVASIVLSWRAKGLSLHAGRNGTLELRGDDGKVKGQFPGASMWDASVDPQSGEHRRRATVAIATRASGAVAGAFDVILKPDARFLADPSLQFPLTIDPLITLGPSYDAFVQTGYVSDQSGSTELKLGWNQVDKARSYLAFNNLGFLAGARITSATLTLFEFHSWSCRAASWEAWRVGAVGTSTRWTTAVPWLARVGTSTTTTGYTSSCPDGSVSIAVTDAFQVAADSAQSVVYLGLRATNEAISDSWKKFNSAEAGSNPPRILLAYNALPAVSGLATTPITVTNGAASYVTSRAPKLNAIVSDPDGGSVTANFEWRPAGGSAMSTAVAVASGAIAMTELPPLDEGGVYEWRVRAQDATQLYSAWSAWSAFTVDTTRPGVPFVASTGTPSYPSTSVDNSWGHGGYGQAGHFSFTPALPSVDLDAFVYQLDTATSSTTKTASGEITEAITPTEDGVRILTVRAKDRAGNLSDPAIYAFNVGRAGLTEPRPGANIVKRTKLTIAGDATYSHVRFQYRRGPGGNVYDIPWSNLTTASGTAVTAVPATPLPLSTFGSHAVWNALDTLGTSGGVVQLRAYLFTASDFVNGYQTQWISANVDPSGDGAASTGIGPGSVNLLTGDYSLSSTDADEFGIKVARSSSSRDPNAGWMPQGERLSPNQQQFAVDTSGLDAYNATMTRDTTRGQGGSSESLKIAPLASGGSVTGPQGDTFVAIGGDFGGLRLGMQPGKRYRARGWIYVPAATTLNLTGPLGSVRGQRIVAFVNAGGTYSEFHSSPASFVDGWQELSLDFTLPPGATEAFVRVYNGALVGQTSRVVYWDNLSLRELVAPFGPQWSGGVADAAAASDYTSLEFPSPDLARIDIVGGDQLTFARSISGNFSPQPGSEAMTLSAPDATHYRLTDADGTVTEFSRQTGANGAFTWPVSSSWTADANTTTAYLYDTTDYRSLVTRVINPKEPGIGDCTAGIPARGCEVFEYSYASTTTATGTTAGAFGDIKDQVKAIRFWAWDPDLGAVTAVEVARYLYDSTGKLREVWDPRVASPLKTGYDYDSAGRVITVTPPGQLPWRFDYGTVGSDGSAGWLLRARRASLVQGTADQIGPENATRIVYQVPLTRSGGGPHDLDATTAETWGQKDIPTDATAVFGPEDDPTVVQASSTVPGPDGYRPAIIHFLNASGREVNTASPSPVTINAIIGNIDSVQYDQYGNVVWSLESTNRLLALGALPDAAQRIADLNLPTDTASRAHLLASVSNYSPDGTDLLDTLGPIAAATLADGTPVTGRSHATHVYDQNKPDGATYHLVTTETSGFRIVNGPNPGTDVETRINRISYDANNGSYSGWILRKPTSISADTATGGSNLTATTVYDSAGRALKSWGHGSTGTDAAAKQTIYYTAGVNSADSACGNRPEWAGQPCVTKAIGAVTGQRDDMTNALPVRRVTSYSRTGEALEVTETAEGKTRTTTTVYDTADRIASVTITSDDGTAPVAQATTSYDTETGLIASTTAGGATITRAYDLLARVVSYTDADGGVTTSQFDRYGRPVMTTDPTGNQSYAYDRTAEPRGFVTSVTDSVAGVFTAQYSPDGQLTTLEYPGGITRTDTLDANFAPIARTYVKSGRSEPIYSEQIELTTRGQWRKDNYTGGYKTYFYDRMDRLTKVRQVDTGGECTTRTYGYDNRTNRTNRRVYAPGAGGVCDETSATINQSHTYDSADRLTDAGYTYDVFGRTVGLPSAMTVSYFANDMVAGLQIGDARQSWTLDPSMRLRGSTTETLINSTWTNGSSKVNHYGDDSDAARWVVEDTDLNVTRNVSGPDGHLAATTSLANGIRLQLTSLHGDVALTFDPASVADVQFFDYDEFGQSVAGQIKQRYGWLGGEQRSGEALGDVILMGARLYSPSLGRFLTVDPIEGGSATAYDYCNADPVNCTDLDGKWGWSSLKKALNVVAVVASVASIIPGPIGTACALVSAGAYAATGNWKQAAIMAAGAALAFVGAGAVAVAAVGVVRVASKVAAAARVAKATATAAKAQWAGKAVVAYRQAKVGVQIARSAFPKMIKAASRGAKAIPRRITAVRNHSIEAKAWWNSNPRTQRLRAAISCGRFISGPLSPGAHWSARGLAWGVGIAVGLVTGRDCPET